MNHYQINKYIIFKKEREEIKIFNLNSKYLINRNLSVNIIRGKHISLKCFL